MTSSLGGLLRVAGVSREHAAAVAGVSKQSVDNWCSGRATPNLEYVSRLARYLKSKEIPEDIICGWVTEELTARGMDTDVLTIGRRAPVGHFDFGGGIVVLGNPAHRPSYRAITAGLAAELYSAGIFNICYLDANNRRDFLDRYLRALAVSENHGAVILGLSLEDYELSQIASTASPDSPVVFILDCPSELPPNSGFVGLDTYGAVKSTTEYLWNKGYRRIAAIGIETEMADRGNADRIAGYEDSIAELGGEPYLVRAFHDFSHSESPADLPHMREAIERVIRNRRIDSLLTLNSAVAREAIKVLHDHSMTVGVDMAMVSVGCRDWMHDICVPPLSHITTPQYGAGRRAARMLLELGGYYPGQEHVEKRVVMTVNDATDSMHSFEGGTIPDLG